MREMIIEIAREQLQSGGYENLHFGRIAEDLSTTRANLHYHFKNKESLAVEAISSYVNEHFHAMKAFAVTAKGDFPKFLAILEDYYISHVKEKGACGGCACSQIIRESGAPESLTQIAKEHFGQMQALMTQIISDSQESGTITKDIPAGKLAMMTFSMIMGAGQMANIYGDDKNFIKEVEGFLVNWIRPYQK